MNEHWEIDALSFEGETKTKTDWGQVINTGLGTADKYASQSKGRLNEDAKQGVASKKEAGALKKRVRAECGNKPLAKKKKPKYEQCRKDTVAKFESKFTEDKTNRAIRDKMISEQLEKESKRKQIIILSVLSVATILVGYVLYKKFKNK